VDGQGPSSNGHDQSCHNDSLDGFKKPEEVKNHLIIPQKDYELDQILKVMQCQSLGL